MNLSSLKLPALGRKGSTSGLTMPRIRPQAIVTAGALLAPVLAVQIVRFVTGAAGPTAASAATSPEAIMLPGGIPGPLATPGASTGPTLPGLPKPSNQQRAALDWIAEHRVTTIAPSPLHRAKPAAPSASITSAPTAQPATQPAPQSAAQSASKPDEPQVPEALTKLELTGILRRGGEALVTISGRQHRLGDTLIPGWTITDVNFTDRRITLTSDLGLAVYLVQNQ
ncbi:MAG: hypothetical protein MUE97_01625 [Phycisphaerales bacterium]|nr:hypothetical protein [Phycisphaerales bacterium]